MSKLTAIFNNEFKRFFCSKKIIIFLLFLLLVGYVVFQDCGDYRNIVAKSEEFQKIEKEIFPILPNYLAYRILGFKVLCIPGPSSIFFNNSGIFFECTAQVTGFISLNIYEDLKGPASFKQNSSIAVDFSGLLKLFGTFYALLFLGFSALRDEKYLKMLSTKMPPWALHPSIIMSRIIVLALKLVLIFSCMYLVIIINKIPLSQVPIAGFAGHFAAALLLMGFFLIIGAIAGQIIESTWKSVTSLVVIWAALMFLIPACINAFNARQAKEITSQYKTELDKSNITFDFEKRIEDKYGKFDRNNIEVERKIIEDFWNNDYRKIMALEEKQKNEIARIVDKYNRISLFTPITFYNLTTSELSTRGYGTFVDFYNYVKDLQVSFIRFIIDRTYYNDPKVLVSFIKENENLFQGTQKLPPDFGKGALINLGIIIALYLFSFFLFKDSLNKIRKEDIKKLGDVNIKLENGILQVWLVKENYFGNLLYNLFSGNFAKMIKKGFTGKVVVNGVDIAAEKNRENFIYVCRPELYPGDLKVKHFFNFYARMFKIPLDEIRTILKNPKIKPLAPKTFSELSNADRFQVLLSILETGKKQVYLIDDIVTGLPVNLIVALKEFMDEQARKGSLMIYLTSTTFSGEDAALETSYIHEGVSWIYFCEANKIKIKHESKSKQE
ncbi:MAG: hypothetical protein KAT34_10485 [Candidatus Aminicenantes bacterium]|nr:hypothetical protein [Candidatus Aminicenantes bacterium]